MGIYYLLRCQQPPPPSRPDRDLCDYISQQPYQERANLVRLVV
jgi:hypothetical protein